MRAIFLNIELQELELIEISGDQAHHLNVIRIKENEEILILNGKGKSALANVLSIQKKNIKVKIKKIISYERKHDISLAISLPKKDAFEEILKISVECGVNEIHPLSSKYSQYQFIESERSNKLIESALIQSNNFYWPSIKPQINLDSFLNSTKSEIFYFTSKPVSIDKKIFSPSLLNSIILIGPEGGFSNEEDEIISNHKNSIPLHLSTPILRAPTATAAAFGYLLALKNMRL